jgi:hypothetical protein
LSATRRSGDRPFWKGGRKFLGLVTLLVAVVVVGAAVGVVVSHAESNRAPVTVTDVLGVGVVYTSGIPHDLGGPVCANCPVTAPPGDRVVLTMWLDWVCPLGGVCQVNLTGVEIAAPFSLAATSPELPGTLFAGTTVVGPPGNGTWATGSMILTVTLIPPASGGTFSLSGTLSVG